jgi:hypothetical protein
MPVVVWAHFIPDHYTTDVQNKLKRIAQLYWTAEEQRKVLAEVKTGKAALVLQEIEQERKELIGTLPLIGIKGGKEPLNFKRREGETDARETD